MLILTNARIVTPSEVFCGTLVAEDGKIARIDSEVTSTPGAVDCQGDFLIPGLIDLHTDALERHMSPRTGVRWPSQAALLTHDAHIAGSGITTVFDSISMGVLGEDEAAHRELAQTWVEAMASLEDAHLRAEHILHLRLELPHPFIVNAFLEFATLPALGLVSLMDHSPGHGQYADVERWRRNLRFASTEEEADKRLRRKLELREQYAEPNRERLAAIAMERGLPLASHDDRTEQEVTRAASLGVTISEFPVTLEAAAAAKRHRMSVVMGGPNLVLGRSHSGNAAASDVANSGWLDCLSSDYVPASMLHGAFLLAQEHGFSLPGAIATVTSRPAAIAGLADRGSLQEGLRADLARVRCVNEAPQPVALWRRGTRVA